MNLEYVLQTELEKSNVDVTVNGLTIFNVTFQRYGLLSDHVYITMEVYSNLNVVPLRILRLLKHKFDELHGYYFFCQVPRGDHRGARWAEFFGFKYINTDLPDRWHYEKDTT